MIDRKNILIISVKPEYAKKIIDKEKTIELRKCAPKKVGKNDYVLIYVTAPIKELWGIYKIENIIKDTPELLWKNFGEKTGITEEEFKNYYKEHENAFGIEIEEVKNLLGLSINIESLKRVVPNFMPPQTYSYINRNLINYSTLKNLLLEK